MPRFCKTVGGVRLRLQLNRLSERFLLLGVNHGEENEDTGHPQGLRGLGGDGGQMTAEDEFEIDVPCIIWDNGWLEEHVRYMYWKVGLVILEEM